MVLDVDGIVVHALGELRVLEHEGDCMFWRDGPAKVEGEKLPNGSQAEDMKSHVLVQSSRGCMDVKICAGVQVNEKLSWHRLATHTTPNVDGKQPALSQLNSQECIETFSVFVR